MKKYIISLIIVIGIFTSFSTVNAATILNKNKIDAVVEILKAFNVEQSKINKIVDILNDGNDGCINENKYSPITGNKCKLNTVNSSVKKVEPIKNNCFWPCVGNIQA